MQLAQTRTRLLAPSTFAFTERRFTFQRRRVVLLAWEMLFPNCGPLPQKSHLAAMVLLQSLSFARPHKRRTDSSPSWHQAILAGKNGRHEETRTPDLYRVKVAL